MSLTPPIARCCRSASSNVISVAVGVTATWCSDSFLRTALGQERQQCLDLVQYGVLHKRFAQASERVHVQRQNAKSWNRSRTLRALSYRRSRQSSRGAGGSVALPD